MKQQWNVGASCLQLTRQGENAHQQAESNHCACQPRGRRNHERIDRILKPDPYTLEQRTLRRSDFLRNRHLQSQRQVSRSALAADPRQQLLCLTKLLILACALRATLYMASQRLHLAPRKSAIQIRREQLLSLTAFHDVTSSSSLPFRVRDRSCLSRSSGLIKPSSAPTSFT